MFADSLTITYNAVTKTLKRVTDGNYRAVYALDEGDLVFNLRVEHTVPGSPNLFGESHLVRLDVDHFVDGEYTRRDSAWTVIKTVDAKQDPIELGYASMALAGFLDQTHVDMLIARES